MLVARNSISVLGIQSGWGDERQDLTVVLACARRYGIVCADNHTGTLTGDYVNTTRIRDTQAGHVLEINLPYNNLRGPIPASIGDLMYLKCVRRAVGCCWLLLCACYVLGLRADGCTSTGTG